MLPNAPGAAPGWIPAPHVRILVSVTPLAVVNAALEAACRDAPSDVRADAATWTAVPNVRALYDALPYDDTLLLLVVDVEQLARSAVRRRDREEVTVADLAGWDGVVLIGALEALREVAQQLDPRLLPRVQFVVRTASMELSVTSALCCQTFRQPAGVGPNIPWSLNEQLAIAALPPRTALALRRLRAEPRRACVKWLASLAGVSRRQLERQFEAGGLRAPAELVARLVRASVPGPGDV
jgi:hypothetical protein